ncbi:hypothetical protein [uncultured Moraxella sp.]|uniref:hypothetical protein n=1 Tax=uncultured Moraxella sp. TaxID=263769 RepID=UPI0025EB1003|nr:hypothetical protein [uncultured Moraxella sp.]
MPNTFEKIFNFLLDASTGSAWLAWTIFVLSVGGLWLFTDANFTIALLFGIPLSLILIIVCVLALFVCYLVMMLLSEFYCIFTRK